MQKAIDGYQSFQKDDTEANKNRSTYFDAYSSLTNNNNSSFSNNNKSSFSNNINSSFSIPTQSTPNSNYNPGSNTFKRRVFSTNIDIIDPKTLSNNDLYDRFQNSNKAISDYLLQIYKNSIKNKN